MLKLLVIIGLTYFLFFFFFFFFGKFNIDFYVRYITAQIYLSIIYLFIYLLFIRYLFIYCLLFIYLFIYIYFIYLLK